MSASVSVRASISITDEHCSSRVEVPEGGELSLGVAQVVQVGLVEEHRVDGRQTALEQVLNALVVMSFHLHEHAQHIHMNTLDTLMLERRLKTGEQVNK